MEKKQLIVLGLSASPASNNAYALILKEADGKRRLPIIIGAFEAQAIALEMEGVVPPRPMTHDLMKSIIHSFSTELTEVFINELIDGTFFAKLIFEDSGIEIDARPSDAIALAVRCQVPIFVAEDILDETGILPQNDDEDSPLAGSSEEDEDPDDMAFLQKQGSHDSPPPPKVHLTKLEIIQNQLDKAIKDENYEEAARLRDELKRFLEQS